MKYRLEYILMTYAGEGDTRTDEWGSTEHARAFEANNDVEAAEEAKRFIGSRPNHPIFKPNRFVRIDKPEEVTVIPISK